MPIPSGNLDKLPDSEVDCPHCHVPLKDAGTARFVQIEGPVMFGAMSTEALQMFVCPKCGKVELYV